MVDIEPGFKELTKLEMNQQTETKRVVLVRDTEKLRWSLPGNEPDQNLRLGIKNVQALFLGRFPEFLLLFPGNEDGKVAEVRVEDARKFILDRIGTQKKFIQVIGGGALNGISVPYFEGSHKIALRKTFQEWGIVFPENPKADPDTGLYFDGQNAWANAAYYKRLFGFDFKLVRRLLGSVSSKEVEDKAGRNCLFFRLDEAQEILSRYSDLPLVDRGSGRYTDSDGVSWVSRKSLAKQYGLDEFKVQKLAEECLSLAGRDRGNHPVTLYKEQELAGKINSFQVLPQVDKSEKAYLDDEGHKWVTTGFIQEKYGISPSRVKYHLKGVSQLTGRAAQGKQVPLYRFTEAATRLEIILALPCVDKESGMYVDAEGQSWLSVNTFCRMKKVDHESLLKHLKDCPRINGRSSSGSQCMLFKKDNMEKIITNIRQKRPDSQTKNAISSEEAGEQLSKLLGG